MHEQGAVHHHERLRGETVSVKAMEHAGRQRYRQRDPKRTCGEERRRTCESSVGVSEVLGRGHR